eukprot:gene35599-43174_t
MRGVLTDTVVESPAIAEAIDDSKVDLALNTSLSSSPFLPVGTSFCFCTTCRSAYLLQEKNIGSKGRRVKCTICNKDWFQTPDKLMKVDESNQLMVLSDEKIEEVKRILADSNVPKKPRNDFTEIFVGNLDFRLDEQDIANLFREYGISHVSLSKDKEGSSKGFAFIEFLTKEDAEQAVAEMNGFYTDARRKLTVRMSEKQVERTAQRKHVEKAPEPSADGKMWSKSK